MLTAEQNAEYTKDLNESERIKKSLSALAMDTLNDIDNGVSVQFLNTRSAKALERKGLVRFVDGGRYGDDHYTLTDKGVNVKYGVHAEEYLSL